MNHRTTERGAGSFRGLNDSATLFTGDDLRTFHEGTHCRLYRHMGAQLVQQRGVPGVCFSVWAPHAAQVSVIGDFNGWNPGRHPLQPVGGAGLWSGVVLRLGHGATYKYHMVPGGKDHAFDKADPYGVRQESAPKTASLVWDLGYSWGDAEWMAARGERQRVRSPISIYEVDPGSWMRVPEEGHRRLTFRELAPKLADYVEAHGFTHVEFLPVMAPSFFGSWGCPTACYFAPSGHHGTPQDLMHLVDTLHQRGIGVILDWIPSHFGADDFGLAHFDGTPLYEHPGRGQGADPGAACHRFHHGRHEVRSFLLSNAVFWLDHYHADGLRVDGVASMLRPEGSPGAGEGLAGVVGGAEDLDALAFLRQLNQTVDAEFPGARTWAGESAVWPQVARPVPVGGLGFGFKWDTPWNRDTLEYLACDPLHRKHRHHQLTARGRHAFAENAVLPLAHDEVAPGRGSLLARMPGDEWQKFANLRLLLAWQWAQPGKKLLFMGGEFGQWTAWSGEASLDWHLVQVGNRHDGLQKLVGQLNWLYRHEPALHESDAAPSGFEWVNAEDAEQSTLSFLRVSERTTDVILAVFNFTPVPRHNTRVGVPRGGFWREVLNTDARDYGGSGQGNQGGVEAAPFGWHFRSHSLMLTLPPLGAVLFKREGTPP
ncbi:MAG: 1,4-alpha-glucan branching protein GlgB [Verrucomicrobia bacterium]|nr:1,4-alpha-glucan branching protein GlgB [Verrucomicrobiota bacterium]